MSATTSSVNVHPTEDEVCQNGSEKICHICTKRFTNASAQRLHLIKVHKAELSLRAGPDGLVYHCPIGGCGLSYEGMRHLQQHYYRAHAEKKYHCECGYRTGMEKDFVYHKKARCKLLKKTGDSRRTSTTQSLPTKKGENNPEAEKVVIKPIFVITTAENLAETVNNLKQEFNLTDDDIRIDERLKTAAAAGCTGERAETRVQEGLVDMGIQSGAFQYPRMVDVGTHYGLYHDQGTHMDPSLGNQMYMQDTYSQYDLTDDMKNQGCSTSFGDDRRTRSFGTTTYDNVTTRHAGTSTAGENDPISQYLRSMQTQTSMIHVEYGEEEPTDNDFWNVS